MHLLPVALWFCPLIHSAFIVFQFEWDPLLFWKGLPPYHMRCMVLKWRKVSNHVLGYFSLGGQKTTWRLISVRTLEGLSWLGIAFARALRTLNQRAGWADQGRHVPFSLTPSFKIWKFIPWIPATDTVQSFSWLQRNPSNNVKHSHLQKFTAHITNELPFPRLA